jgi:hypothetical protein
VTVTKDAAFCGKFDLVDESLLVDKDGGLANVVVWLSPKADHAPPAPHASYEQTADAKILLDNKDCRFVPRVVLLRTTQTLAIKASDPAPVSHNANIASEHNPINPSLAPGEQIERQFRKAERMPASVSCGSHPWMKGWLVIKDTPYMAVSDEEGRFAIANLPAGKWTFQFWHEKLGFIRAVEVGGAAKAWPRGRVEIPVDSGQTTDLGPVKLKLADHQ